MALQFIDEDGKKQYADPSNDPAEMIRILTEANENLKIEQAQANSEMIELMMSMLGGTL